MRTSLPVLAAALVALLAAPDAAANGRFPQSNQIVFSPNDSGLVVVRTTYGIIFSHDAGAHWQWLCEDLLGLGPQSNEDPFLGLTANDSLVAGLSLGLHVSRDTGCDWTTIGGPLAGQNIKDLVVHAGNPHVVDAITSTYGPTAGNDGGPGYAQQLYETTDDGVAWTPLGTPVDATAVVTSVEVAPSDPSRIYVSAFRGEGPARTAWLFVSTDKGATWTAEQTPLDAMTEAAVYIGAVDPNDEDLVYLRTEGASRLLVTNDAGRTFQSSKQLVGQMLGFALSQDGSKVYLGGVEDGLFVGDAKTLAFKQVSMIHVQCLATHGSDLWACSDEPSGFVAGVSHDDGASFTPEMHLLSIGGPLSCSAGAAAARCVDWFLEGGLAYNPFVSLCSSLGACYDAGPQMAAMSACQCTGACSEMPLSTFDASATCPSGGAEPGRDGGAAAPPPRAKSGGCSEVAQSGGSVLGFFAAGALGAAAAVRRRRGRGARRRDA